MRINKKNFLIQVKYSDLLKDAGNIEKYFLGFGGELYFGAEEIDSYEPGIIDGIKSFVKNNRLPLRLHAPIVEIDYSKDAASYIQSLYRSVIRLCKALSIDSVVTHAEFDYNGDFPIDKQFENAYFLWHGVCDELRTAGIRLNVENHYEKEPGYLIRLMKKINSPYFGMCVDIGHWNAFSDLDMEKWLREYPAGSIKEIHLADNKGDDDTHLPLGGGNIDFTHFFESLSKRRGNYVFVLEPREFEEAGESLSYLRKRGVIE